MKDAVLLLGGYAGDGASEPDRCDVSAFVTKLSGDIGAAGVAADNSTHVVVGSGCTASALLDGFTVQDGAALGSGDASKGGGMFNDGDSPRVEHCTFSNNMAGDGGGVYSFMGSPTFANCLFVGNKADIYGKRSGGGMYNHFCNATLTNCTFINNFAGYSGGGVLNTDSEPILLRCTFTGNAATTRGGAVSNERNFIATAPTFSNCTFNLNHAGIFGGALCNVGGTPLITDSDFVQNSVGGLSEFSGWRCSL